jgi:hypothetical protein
MAANVFECPECSQLITTNRKTCKGCGAGLKQVSHSITHIEKVAGRHSTLILNFIIAVAILGIIIAVAVPKAFSYSTSSPLSNARGVGSAMSATITDLHANYLKDGTDYTASDVVADTPFSGGITATTGVPGDRQISAVSPTTIRLNFNKHKVFKWDYIPRNGDTAAKIVESVDFGKAAETDSTLNLIITFVILIGFIIVVSLPFYFKNPSFTPTYTTRADLNKALKKIRDACISGLVSAGYLYLLFIVSLPITENITNPDTFFWTFLITAVLFGLPFGVYKRSRFCAIALFMSILCSLMLHILVSTTFAMTSLEKMYIGVGCVLACFTFEGIRGTFTYHKLFKTIQEKNKSA